MSVGFFIKVLLGYLRSNNSDNGRLLYLVQRLGLVLNRFLNKFKLSGIFVTEYNTFLNTTQPLQYFLIGKLAIVAYFNLLFATGAVPIRI